MTDQTALAPMPIGVDDPASDYHVPGELRPFYAADPPDPDRDGAALHDRDGRAWWLYLRDLDRRRAEAYERRRRGQATDEDAALLPFDKEFKEPYPQDPNSPLPPSVLNPAQTVTKVRTDSKGRRHAFTEAAPSAFRERLRPLNPIKNAAIIDAFDRPLTADERPLYLHELRLGRAAAAKQAHDQAERKQRDHATQHTCRICQRVDESTRDRALPRAALALAARGSASRYKACEPCEALLTIRLAAWADVPVEEAGGRLRGELVDDWLRTLAGDPTTPRALRL